MALEQAFMHGLIDSMIRTAPGLQQFVRMPALGGRSRFEVARPELLTFRLGRCGAAGGQPALFPRLADRHHLAGAGRIGRVRTRQQQGGIRQVNGGPGNVVPLSIDMSAMVRRSVASLYSHLVTRPTGQALRMGIESQLAELGDFCVSILDFTQVIVLDYSCADEAVAKLILRYQREDRPAEAYFIVRGVAEQHLEPIESVLSRHGLALVAFVEGEGYTLLGTVSEREREGLRRCR